MTLFQTLSDVCDVLKITKPASFFNSADTNVTQLVACANQWAREVVDEGNWPELQKEYTFTLVNGQESYALPPDFNNLIYSTEYNRATRWPLYGPLNAQEWQLRKSSMLNAGFRTEYRIKGSLAKQIFINQTPTASEDGQIMVFEYRSNSVVRPVEWTTATNFDPGTYCSYNGNNYFTTAGGTTGATPPTHTSGTVSDGSVAWTYLNETYNRFRADTDVCLLDDHLLFLACKYMWQKENNFDYSASEADYVKHLRTAIGAHGGECELTFTDAAPRFRYINEANIPYTGYGS